MASADGNGAPSPTAMDTSPAQCVAGCGFFGNPNTANMCSKCYKDTLAKSASKCETSACPPAAAAPSSSSSASTLVPAPEKPPAAMSTPPAAASAKPELPSYSKPELQAPRVVTATTPARPTEGEEPGDEPPKKKQVNTNRCWTCNKKIGLLGYQCKCDYYFCAEHRYSDKHACDFDFKAMGKQQLTKANPTIAPSKLDAM